ncbi:MAG: complex I subunit 1 family protein [candidate division WOR-3 bacterium]
MEADLTALRTLFEFLIFPGFLFLAAVGMLLTWVDRKVSARVQWRVGPPWYQPLADFLKLLLKEPTVPEGAARPIFLLAPILGLIAAVTVGMMLFTMNFQPGRSFVGDLVVVIYLLAFIPLGTILGASASRNPLAAVGASREMTLYFAYELPLILALLVPVIKTGSLRIGTIVLAQQQGQSFLYSVSGVIALLVAFVCMQAKLGLPPFDIAEAEQEIMAGPVIEYSGVTLALFRLTRAMLYLLLPVLLITLFWAGVGNWWAILKFLLLFVLVVLVKNTNPRLRIDQALRLFWIGLAPLAAVAVVFALLGW